MRFEVGKGEDGDWVLLNTFSNKTTTHETLGEVQEVFKGIAGENELWGNGQKILPVETIKPKQASLPKKPRKDTKTYELHKLALEQWMLTQGSLENEISIIFKSAKSALNYVENKSKGTSLVFKDKPVDDTLAKSLDKVSFIQRVKFAYDDVKSIKVRDNTTTVVLEDGRVGVTRLHKDDKYSEQLGFMYAYNKARLKPYILTDEEMQGIAIEEAVENIKDISIQPLSLGEIPKEISELIDGLFGK